MDWKGCEQTEVDPCRSMVQPVVKGSRIRAATIVERWELGEELSDITEAIDNATPRRHQFIEYPYAYRPRKKT